MNAPQPTDPECKTCASLHPDQPVRRWSEHVDTCRICGRDRLHHEPGDDLVELQAAARMAVARRDAGLELNDTAVWALEVWGEDDLGRVGESLTSTAPVSMARGVAA